MLTARVLLELALPQELDRCLAASAFVKNKCTLLAAPCCVGRLPELLILHVVGAEGCLIQANGGFLL